MRKIIGAFIGGIGAVALLIGVIGKIKDGFSISLTKGSDGPTSVFVAGKLGTDYTNAMIIYGIVCTIISGIILFVRKH